MAGVTVKELAKLVGLTPEDMLSKLTDAGVSLSNTDSEVNDEQKKTLITFLRTKKKPEAAAPAAETKPAPIKRPRAASGGSVLLSKSVLG